MRNREMFPNSTAVMARRVESLDSLDDFPTPPWAGRALIEYVLKRQPNWTPGQALWEPAANRGYLFNALYPYFGEAKASDIFDYGCGYEQANFLDTQHACDWVITNPPFVSALDFLLHGLSQAKRGVALLVRTQWMEGIDRYQRIFSETPPTIWAVFSERVPMVRGRIDPEASSATSYSWAVWDKTTRQRRSELVWIPPCRKELEQLGDYPEAPAPLFGEA